MKIPSLKGEFVKSTGLVFLATLSANLIVFFANILFSKELGPELFGIFKTIFYLFSFLPVLIEFGINVTLTKYIAEFGEREKIGFMVKWFLKLKILSYLILIISLFFFTEQISSVFLNDSSLSYLVISGIFLSAFTFFSFFEFIILGFQKFKLFAISQFLILTTSSVFAILLIPFGIFYMIIGWAFGPLLGNLFNIKFFFDKKILKYYKEFNIKRIFWKFSIPMYFINIPVALVSIIVPLLSLFFSPEVVGYYSFGFIFYSATLLIPTATSNILFPKISELNGLKKYKDAKDFLKKVFVFYSLIVLFGVFFVLLLSDSFFVVFFKDFLPSLFIFKTLVIFGFIFGYNTIYVNYLRGLGKVKRFALFVLVQNILLIIISFALLTNM